MRPKMLEAFDGLRERNIIVAKEAKEAGEKIVGMYCVFSPQELIVAAGAHPITLCGTKQEPIAAAEKVLPRNLCPLIKSSYGFAATDTCPYFHFADLLIAETTCDGKKKMYELMAEYKPMQILQLPQTQEGPEAMELWLKEVAKTKARLETEFGVEISDEKLREAIKLVNRERRVLKELHALCKHRPAPLTGLELLTAIWLKGFNIQKEKGIKMVEDLIAEVKELMAQGIFPVSESAPRILVTGVPVGIGSEKVIRLIEECGGSVVVLENCSGYKPLDVLVDESAAKDPLVAIAEKYLSIPCSCMSPNEGRYELVSRLAQEYQVDGVVDITWIGCHTYNIESYSLKKALQEQLNLPFLQLETDYSSSDVEQLKVRIEAFLEMLR